MEAEEFIQTTIDNLNIETKDMLKQREYIEAIFYFDIEADLLYEEFKYLQGDMQLLFLQGLSKLLPFSQQLYAKFIEHAEQKEELSRWIVDANEKYLDTLYEIFGGGDFEESYEQIEDEIMTLNATLEKLKAGYLQNKIKQKDLKQTLSSIQTQNSEILDEIKHFENAIEQTQNQISQANQHKIQLENELKKLQAELTKTKEAIENFQSDKSALQKELVQLTEEQKDNDKKLKEIKEKTQQVLSQNELYKKEQERLKQFQKELQAREKFAKLIETKLKNYFGHKKTDIEKELKSIKTSLQKLYENFEKSQEEKIVEEVSKGAKS